MKLHITLLASILLMGCTQQSGNAETKTPPSNPDTQQKHMPDASKASATSGTQAAGTGTVQTVDSAAGTVSIAHGAIAAVRWPAMTMTFKTSPEQLTGVRVGEKVTFKFVLNGTDATITSISQVR